MHRFLGLFLLVTAFLLGFQAGAFADTKSRCDKDKLVATARSLKGAFACSPKQLSDLTLSTYDANCIAGLSSSFRKTWGKAIEKAARKGDSCFNAPSADGVLASILSTGSGVSTVLRSGFEPRFDDDPDAVRSFRTLMKACEAYLKSTLTAQASHANKPNAKKLAKQLAGSLKKLEISVVRETSRLNKKGITYAGDAGAVAAVMDATVGGLALGISQNPTFPVGVFVDSGVEGLEYAPGLDGEEGITLRGGLFPVTAAVMTFSVGDFVLGSATVPANTRTVTPVLLVPGAQNETNSTVTNIARFLQTIDDDAKAANGISIPSAILVETAGVAIDVSDTSAVVDLAESLTPFTKKGQRAAVSAGDAQEHLNSTLVAGFAGKYEGTFSGTDFGTWELTITPKGSMKGGGVSADSGKFGAKGKVVSDGSATLGIGSVSTGASFSGVIDNGGHFSGSWENGPDNGTFAGDLLVD